MTTIIGIDAATEAKKLGLARGRLDASHLIIDEAVLGSEMVSVMDTITSWIDGPTLIAVDAPLGWPSSLGGALRDHRAGRVIAVHPHDLFRRMTDKFVHETLGKLPLEVGADRIARTAHAALMRLGDLREGTGLQIPLAWTPRVDDVACIEVYPAATLKARRVDSSGCKGPKGNAPAARERVIAAIRHEFLLSVDIARLVSSDHRLDAVVCVLAGADFLQGKCVAPDDNQREVATVEGWIWFRVPASRADGLHGAASNSAPRRGSIRRKRRVPR